MRAEKKYGGLDIFRLIGAFLVAAIHTSPLESFSGDADFFLTRVLARIAVPFFFMVTGQFVMAGYLPVRKPDLSKKQRQRGAGNSVYAAQGPTRRRDGTGQMGEDGLSFHGRGHQAGAAPLLRQLKKLCLLYGAAILLYLPLGIYAGYYKGMTPLKGLRMLFFDGTFYHLWYFPACIVGILLVYFLSRFLKLKELIAAAGLLYLIGVFGDSYYGLAAGISGVSAFYEGCFQIFSYTRNGLFFAPLFLILGAVLGNAEPETGWKEALGFVGSLLLMTAEAFLLRYFDLMRHDSMYLALIPAMIFLYRWLLSLPAEPKRELRTLSTWIYLLHPAMIVAVRGAAKLFPMAEILVKNSLLYYLAVCILSLAAALIAVGAAKAFSGRKKETDAEFSAGRAWIELDAGALRENVNALRFRLPQSCYLMPAVKANAYGHGAVLISRELNRLGVEDFCVASVTEGVDLRKAGVQGDILILGYTHPKQFGLLVRYDLIQTVIDHAYALELNRYGKKLRVHIAVDTGMHRLGERSDHSREILKIAGLENLMVEGIYTHLCASDTREDKAVFFTERQVESFYRVLDDWRNAGLPMPKIHLQSSYGVLNYPEFAEDYSRVGIALYGTLSTKEDTENSPIPLKPVLSLKARVTAVKELYQGESAGYGMAFTAEKNMRIAVLAIGYADGYPRALSNGAGEVLINGKRAPIIGRICMDQTIVDASSVPEVKTGDIAVLLGKSGAETITAGDLARQAGTITNEILSRLGERLERVMV